MSIICLADQTEHETIKALHAHLRHFKIKQASYYQQYHPRLCKGTGQPIPYKDYEQYWSQDFIDKNAIKEFLTKEPAKGREWAINWLRKRKEEKGLVYAPSQVELRSLQCPSQPYFDFVGGYYHITRELGFKDRYRDEVPSFTHTITGVIQDSREQQPLKLGIKTVVAKVNEGDYGLSENDLGVYIERKGLGDFVGTLSSRSIERVKSEDSNLARFDRELARATKQGHYIVMLVEASIQTALEYNDPKSPHYVESMKWSSASPSYVFKNLRDLLTKYPLSFQAVFMDGRVNAAQKALRIFQMGDQVRRVDLQNALEKGLL